jgi:hypothetical protein
MTKHKRLNSREKAYVIKWLLKHGPNTEQSRPEIGWQEVARLISEEGGFPVTDSIAYHAAKDLNEPKLLEHYRKGVQYRPINRVGDVLELASIVYEYIEAHPSPSLLDSGILARLLKLIENLESMNV